MGSDMVTIEQIITAYFGSAVDQNDIDPDSVDAARIDRITAIIAAHSAPAALPTLMEEEQWQVSYAMRLVDPKTGEDGGDSTIAASRLRTCLFNVLAIIDHIRAKP